MAGIEPAICGVGQVELVMIIMSRRACQLPSQGKSAAPSRILPLSKQAKQVQQFVYPLSSVGGAALRRSLSAGECPIYLGTFDSGQQIGLKRLAI